MANFFLDNKDLQFHLNHPLMKKIVELRERGYADKGKFDYAPVDFEDAMDSYRRVMEICCEICGDVLAPKRSKPDTFPAFAPEKPARWTSPNPMPAATCRL